MVAEINAKIIPLALVSICYMSMAFLLKAIGRGPTAAVHLQYYSFLLFSKAILFLLLNLSQLKYHV